MTQDDLTKRLNELWSLRHAHSDDFGDLVNILQSYVLHPLLDSQREVIDGVIRDCLEGQTIDIDGAVKQLRAAGFDVWQGISQSSYV